MSNTLFSVIIVSFNAGDSIRKTILSTLSQTYKNFEIIVKDGLSGDDTIKNIPDDSRIKIIENKDHGIYDAMNQAVTYASGTYAIFMNCGDLFFNNKVLETVDNEISGIKEDGSSPDIIYGNFERDGIIMNQPAHMTDYVLYRSTLNHQSVFFKLSNLQERFRYNTRFRMMADYELLVRLWKNGRQFLYINIPVCKYEGNGVSESEEGIRIRKAEREAIRCSYFSRKERLDYSFKYALTLPSLRKLISRHKENKIVGKLYYRLRNVYYRNSK